MSARDVLNRVLINRGYEIVKSNHFGTAQIELDNSSIASRVKPGRKHVWLVAPPKSGSTWLSVLLAKLLRWPVVELTNGYDRREQEVDLRPILRYPAGNIFSPQQHCRASKPTTDFIKQFGVTPIVQTRNIFDSVISFRDHLFNEGLGMPMAHIDARFFQLSEERQYDLIIDLVLPWYFNFYASWLSNEEIPRSELLFVTYEDLMADTANVLRRILDHVGEARSGSDIQGAIAVVSDGNTRKNKAVVGRGDRLLSDGHKAKIRHLREYYENIDFSMIGL